MADTSVNVFLDEDGKHLYNICETLLWCDFHASRWIVVSDFSLSQIKGDTIQKTIVNYDKCKVQFRIIHKSVTIVINFDEQSFKYIALDYPIIFNHCEDTDVFTFIKDDQCIQFKFIYGSLVNLFWFTFMCNMSIHSNVFNTVIKDFPLIHMIEFMNICLNDFVHVFNVNVKLPSGEITEQELIVDFFHKHLIFQKHDSVSILFKKQYDDKYMTIHQISEKKDEKTIRLVFKIVQTIELFDPNISFVCEDIIMDTSERKNHLRNLLTMFQNSSIHT